MNLNLTNNGHYYSKEICVTIVNILNNADIHPIYILDKDIIYNHTIKPKEFELIGVVENGSAYYKDGCVYSNLIPSEPNLDISCFIFGPFGIGRLKGVGSNIEVFEYTFQSIYAYKNG